MSFKDLVLKNRSCRTFDESFDITRDVLLDLVDHARISPAARNVQPLKYYLSYTKETNGIIQPLTKWGGALPQLNLPPEGHRPTAFIVICYDKSINGDSSAPYMKDVGICAQTIMLAAAEKDISGCMIGMFSPEKVAQSLGLSDNLEPVLILGLGKRDEKAVIVEPIDGKTAYYRDENNLHYVPKRPLEEEIIN